MYGRGGLPFWKRHAELWLWLQRSALQVRIIIIFRCGILLTRVLNLIWILTLGEIAKFFNLTLNLLFKKTVEIWGNLKFSYFGDKVHRCVKHIMFIILIGIHTSDTIEHDLWFVSNGMFNYSFKGTTMQFSLNKIKF